jgi:Mg2+/Co2+ transporter CorB
MVHRKNVTMFNIEDPIEGIVEQVLDSPYTRIPFWRDNPDNIVGVLHAKLLLRALRKSEGDVGKIDLSEVMMEPRFIPESTALNEQLQAFRANKEHFAVVIDEYGSFMGIVTLEDILEEIVGDIDDEHDETMQGVKVLAGNRYMVDGTVTIRDLNRGFNWDLPDEEYSTLAGLILYESQTIPKVGQSFRYHGFTFDVVKRHKNQITMIRITPPADGGY